jgi:hypothetical protein
VGSVRGDPPDLRGIREEISQQGNHASSQSGHALFRYRLRGKDGGTDRDAHYAGRQLHLSALDKSASRCVTCAIWATRHWPGCACLVAQRGIYFRARDSGPDNQPVLRKPGPRVGNGLRHRAGPVRHHAISGFERRLVCRNSTNTVGTGVLMDHTAEIMAIDDPISAVQKQLEIEQIERSRVTEALAKLVAEVIPGAGILRNFMEEHRVQNWELLLKVLLQEIKALRERVDELDETHRLFLREQFYSLLIDGLRRAENLPAKERVKRIALILANAAKVGPSQPFDSTEELMRVAMELSDLEVEYLRQLNEFHPFPFDEPGGGLTTVEEANRNWADRHPSLGGVDNSDYQSIALKLQSFGLIEAVERRPVIVGPDITPYRMLKKGAAFVRFIQSENPT